MKLKINRATFQTMVAKATKGAGMSNDLGITQLMAVQLKDNVLTLITTDGSNYLYVTEKIAGEDFYVVVPVDKFSKLIAKLTCEDVTLEIPKAKQGELDKLVIHGNGKYVIELPYDGDGELVEFPDPYEEDDGSEWSKGEVNLSTIKLILTTAKAALLAEKEDTCYSGYYFGERVIATDTYKICGIDIQIFDEAKLLPPRIIDLLEVMTEEKIEVRYNEDTVAFITDKVIVYGDVMEGIEEYQIDAINNLLDDKFPSSCKIEKSALLQMLDRLALFVDTYDKNGVYLTFTKDGIVVSSKKDSCSELIPYKESNSFVDYTCCLDIDMFRQQVKACPSDVVDVLYGKPTGIKFVVGNTKQIIGLSTDDRVSEEEDEESEEGEE